MEPELIASLLPLLQKHGVHAYFCGHDHDLQHLQAGDVNLLVSGGGSEHRPNHPIQQSRFTVSASGLMAVSLTAQAMAVRVIDSTGASIYQTSIS